MSRGFAIATGASAALVLAACGPGVAAQTASTASAAGEPTVVSVTPLNEPAVAYVLKPGDTLAALADKYFVRRPANDEVRVRKGARYVTRIASGLELLVPARLLRTEPVDARVGAFKGDVTITGPGGAAAAQVGLAVREGAVITTGANAFARIDLPDGSRVSVPSQSRVRLSVLHKVLLSAAIERSFTVEDGRSETAAAPTARPQDGYVVRTPLSVAAVRSPDFNAGPASPVKAAVADVVEVQAPAGDASSARLPAPTVRAAAHGLDEPVVTFDLEPVPGAKAYRARLARDAGLSAVVAEQTQSAPQFAFPGLDDGDYFLQVSAVDSADVEGRARLYGFQRDLNAIIPVGASAEGGRTDRRFVLKWQVAGEGARAYRVQVTREASAAAPLVDEGGLEDTQITLTNLPAGEYRWRVMSSTARKGGLVEKWTPPQKFTVPAN